MEPENAEITDIPLSITNSDGHRVNVTNQECVNVENLSITCLSTPSVLLLVLLPKLQDFFKPTTHSSCM